MLSESLQMRARLASTIPCIGLVSKDTLRSCGFYSELLAICSLPGKTCTETLLFIKLLPVETMTSSSVSYLLELMLRDLMPVSTPHLNSPLTPAQELYYRRPWALLSARELPVAISFSISLTSVTSVTPAKTSSAPNALPALGSMNTRKLKPRRDPCAVATAALTLLRSTNTSYRPLSISMSSPL